MKAFENSLGTRCAGFAYGAEIVDTGHRATFADRKPNEGLMLDRKPETIWRKTLHCLTGTQALMFDGETTANEGMHSEALPNVTTLGSFLESNVGKQLLKKYVRDVENKSKVYRGGQGVIYIGRLLNSTDQGIECIIRAGLRPIDTRVLKRTREHSSLFVHVIDQIKVTIENSGWVNGSDFYIQFMVKLPYSLAQKLDDTRSHEKIRGVAIAVSKALLALHKDDSSDMCFCHRDIKPANILLDDTGHVYLGDLDLAARITDDAVLQENSWIGTEGYKAPELNSLNGRYSEKTDIYALGVTLSQLMTGNKNPQDALKLLGVMKSKEYSDPGLLEIVKACVALDPNDRPSASKILADLASPKNLIKTRWPKKRLAWACAVVLGLLAATISWNIILDNRLKYASDEIARQQEHLVKVVQSVRSSVESSGENVAILEQLCVYSPNTLLDDETAAIVLKSAIRYKQDAKYEAAIEHLEWLDQHLSKTQASIRAQCLHEIGAIAYYSGVPSKRIPNPGISSAIESVFQDAIKYWEITLKLPPDSASAQHLKKTFNVRFPNVRKASEVIKLLNRQGPAPLHENLLSIQPGHNDPNEWNGLARTWGYLGDLYRNGTPEERLTALTLYALSASVRKSIEEMGAPGTDGVTKQIIELSNAIEVCRSLENFAVWSWLDVFELEEPEARELYELYFKIIEKLKNAIPHRVEFKDLNAILVLDRAYSDYSHMFLQACLLVPKANEECLDLEFHEEVIAKTYSQTQRECLQLQRAAMRALAIYPDGIQLHDVAAGKQLSLTEIQNSLAEKALLHFEEDGAIGWGSASAVEIWLLCESQSRNGKISVSELNDKVKPMSAATINERINKATAFRRDLAK